MESKSARKGTKSQLYLTVSQECIELGVHSSIGTWGMVDPEDGRHAWIVGQGPILRKIQIGDAPDLFMRFAQSISDTDALKRFVKTYGVPRFAGPNSGPRCPIHHSACAYLPTYLLRAQLLKFLISLHGAIEDDDLAFLSSHRKQLQGYAVYFRNLVNALPDPDKAAEQRDAVVQAVRNSPLDAAAVLISDALTFHLGTLLPQANSISSYVTSAFWYQPKHGLKSSAFRFAFDHLVYLQFAMLIQQRDTIAVCEGCHELFRKTRPNKRHCDDACGSRARMRRLRAKRTRPQAPQQG